MAIIFVIIAVLITAISFYVDFVFKCDINWFSRSGALLALSGASLEYGKLLKLWESAKHNEQSLESVKSRIERKAGVGLKETAEESVQTRDFAIRIYDVLTQKDKLDILAFILVVAGTLIWAYGDIPFVKEWL